MSREPAGAVPRLLVAASVCLGLAPRAAAQLDPLLFLKSARPFVVIAVDRSSRMQRDLADDYRDPRVYRRTGDAWEPGLGVTADNTAESYRRLFSGLSWMDPGAGVRAEADTLRVVGDRQGEFSGFDGATRLGIVRAAVIRAVEQNRRSVAFGLIASRQATPSFASDPPLRVRVTRLPAPSLPSDTDAAGEWSMGGAEVTEPGADQPSSPPLVRADEGGSNDRLLRLLAAVPPEPGALVAAGYDTRDSVDAPVLRLLDDAHSEASRLVAADSGCHNTIVVLITAGDQAPALDPPLDQRSLDFLRTAGRRVPVHVIALAPGDAARARLTRVATNTGGSYEEVAAPPDTPRQAVHAVVRAVNRAVQQGIARFADLSVDSAAGPPPGRSEYSIAAPVVGTVNLEGARGADGQYLPGTRVTTADGVVIPQSSNVVITAGFEVPGFLGRLHGFRVYRPETDGSALLGYRFVADGTRLWTAAAPQPDRRNLYTIVPGQGMVRLDEGNAALLAPYLRTGGVEAAARLIRYLRNLPLGAITHSTPALLTPPAGDVADPEYQAFLDANRERRTLLFVGADDGMLHAVDARTGNEAWAVVPFNLLPRLHLLEDGQPLDDYAFFVAGSPRLADVHTSGGWRTMLFVGEGAGGTFFQAFDVTLGGIAGAVPADSDSVDAVLGWFTDPGRIPLLWSFPSYAHFDPELAPAGDVSASGTVAEKSVGETWSTPSVFRLGSSGPSVVVVGSGPLAASAERRANRAGVPAGRTLYLLDAETGGLLDSTLVESDGLGEDQDSCPPAGCPALKNALAADPSVLLAAGAQSARVYLGDLDGRLWRSELRQEATGPRFTGPPQSIYQGPPGEPLFAAAAVARPGLDRTFVFVAAGSDLAPTARAVPSARLLALEDTGATAIRRGELAVGSGATDERPSSLPAVAGDVVFFSTSVLGGPACEPGTSRLYALTFGWGAAYDWSGDGRRDANDVAALGAVSRGRASPPVAADRHVFVAAGDRLQVFGDRRGYNQGPGFAGVRVLSWREVH